MIDDIVEESAKGIIKTIFDILFRIIFKSILFYTGEFLLFFLSLGRKKPRWDYYSDEKASRFIIFTEFSVWIGFAFWLFIAWFINARVLN